MSAFLPASVPPGWYPDPEGHPQQRWWTGSGWTANTAPTGSAPAAPAHGFTPISAAPPRASFVPMAAAPAPAGALPFAPSPAAAPPYAAAPSYASTTALPFAPAPERAPIAAAAESSSYDPQSYAPQASSAFPAPVTPVPPGQIAAPPALPGMAALPAGTAPQSALAGLPGPAVPAAAPVVPAPLAIEAEPIPGLSYPSATSPDNYDSPVNAPFAARFAATAFASAQDYALAETTTETKSTEQSAFTASPYVAGTPFVPAADDAGSALAPLPAPSTTGPAIPPFSITAFTQAPIVAATPTPSFSEALFGQPSFADQSLAAKSLSGSAVDTQMGFAGAPATSSPSISAQAFAAQAGNKLGVPQYSRSTDVSFGVVESTDHYKDFAAPGSRKRIFREPQLTYTGSVWSIVLMPLFVVGVAAAVALLAPAAFTPVVQLALVGGAAVLAVLLALIDRRQLAAAGHKNPASPAWMLLTPLVYLGVRYARTRKETRKGFATIAVWVLVVAALAAGSVLLPSLTATLTSLAL